MDHEHRVVFVVGRFIGHTPITIGSNCGRASREGRDRLFFSGLSSGQMRLTCSCAAVFIFSNSFFGGTSCVKITSWSGDAFSLGIMTVCCNSLCLKCALLLCSVQTLCLQCCWLLLWYKFNIKPDVFFSFIGCDRTRTKAGFDLNKVLYTKQPRSSVSCECWEQCQKQQYGDICTIQWSRKNAKCTCRHSHPRASAGGYGQLSLFPGN